MVIALLVNDKLVLFGIHLDQVLKVVPVMFRLVLGNQGAPGVIEEVHFLADVVGKDTARASNGSLEGRDWLLSIFHL